MNTKVIAALAVVVLAGAAVAAVPIVESHAAASIKTEIERDGTTKVGTVEVGLFERRVALLDLKSTGDAALSVGRWEASGLAWPLGELIRGRTPLAGSSSRRAQRPVLAARLERHVRRGLGCRRSL